MKKVIYAIIMFLSIITIAKASEFNFEESEDLDFKGIYTACAQVESKAYCLGYKTYTSYADVHEIDLETKTNRIIKTLNSNYFYSSLVKVEEKYIASGFSLRNGKTVITILDKEFNTIKTENISSVSATSGFIVKKIDDSYYILSQAITKSKHAAAKVSSDLETIEIVDLEDLTDKKYDIIRAYNEIDNVINKDSLKRLILEIEEKDGGYIVTNAQNTGIYSSIIYYKDGEIKWEKEEGGSLGTFVIKNNHIYLFNEHTKDYETSLIEITSEGESLVNYNIKNINDQKRFFLMNYYIGEYNNLYYYFTYNPVEVENAASWSNWRITTLSISNPVENNSTDSIEIKDNYFTGEEVEIKIKEEYKDKIDKIIVKDENGNEIEVIDNKFIMPNSKITIEATYLPEKKNPETGDYTMILIVTLFILSFIYILKTYFNKTKSIKVE